ncbi:conserved exported hypothetical protein [Candidatus Sulfopaludibacter sp. SbA4]|nr:conserved exported hypothetical protein [Candidatus Sulfopaludibacter sp. SbA4]
MRWISLFCCAAAALGQPGTDPKAKAEDYEAHGRSKDLAIGAEYMIHSFSGQGQTYIAKDFLVVEVALYPLKGQRVDVNEGRFALRINGKKQALTPAPPQMVATTLQHPEWQTGPRLEGGGGLGNAGVILGRPVPSQVPGGQRPPAPLPSPADNPTGVESEPRVKAPELVVQVALPEGPHSGPVSGFLYFPYKGKTTSIKSLELLYEDVVLQLM